MKKDYSKWLIVSDIDGTLNSKFRVLPKKNFEAIKNFTANGGKFTLASGRLVSSLERNYNKITANCPAVVLNGAGIYDFKERKMLWRSTISDEGRGFTRGILSGYNRLFNRVEVGIFFDDCVYIVRQGILSRGQMLFDKSPYKVTKIDNVSDDGWMKVVFWSNPVVISHLKNKVSKFGDCNMNFMATSPWSLEMLAKGTHKGVAVLELAKLLGIEKENVGAIGDYYNDYEMLESVGIPACAGQAPSKMKQICEYVACHCNKGCVADFINYVTKKADSLLNSDLRSDKNTVLG